MKQAARIFFPSDLSIGTNAEGNPVLTLNISGEPIHDPFLTPDGQCEIEAGPDYGVPYDLARAMWIVNRYLADWAKAEKDPVKALARRFSEKLRAYLTPEQLVTVIDRNRTESDSRICHSHDFCDANMLMLEAGQELGYSDEELLDNVALVSNAWSLAKAFNFQHG